MGKNKARSVVNLSLENLHLRKPRVLSPLHVWNKVALVPLACEDAAPLDHVRFKPPSYIDKNFSHTRSGLPMSVILSHIPVPAHRKDKKRTSACWRHAGRISILDVIVMLK